MSTAASPSSVVERPRLRRNPRDPRSSIGGRSAGTDRAVGATAGGISAAALLASVVLARFTSTPARIGLLCLWAAMVAGAFVWGARSRRPVRSVEVRPPDRPARRRRLRSFLITAAVCVAGSAVALVFLGCSVVAVVPGILAAGATAAARSSSVSLRPSRPVRWIPLLILVIAVPALFSLETSLTANSADSLSIRAVEWLRDNGGAGVVNGTEHWWYTKHAPPVGGTPSTVPPAPTGTDLAVTLRPLTSPATPPLPGEGQWTVTAGTPQHPAVATTFLRPDATHTSVVVGVMRIDPSLVRMRLIPGTEQPGGSVAGNGAVPTDDRASLVATFNAGFRMNEANGGWFSASRTAESLRDGSASLVLRDDGRADVGVWGRDDHMDPHVTAVRQNLALIVDGGRLVPGTQDAANLLWGKTLGHKVLVNRSGIGVTADGALVYVGGPGMSVATLGRTLIAAGAVRAMEMDINTAWVNAFTYTSGPTGPAGTKLVDSMTHGPDRYLRPQTRDFVDVTLDQPHS